MQQILQQQVLSPQQLQVLLQQQQALMLQQVIVFLLPTQTPTTQFAVPLRLSSCFPCWRMNMAGRLSGAESHLVPR